MMHLGQEPCLHTLTLTNLSLQGTRMSVEMQSAGATVYGVPDGSYRPWLPRWFENWQGLNEICYQFIAYTAGRFPCHLWIS